MKNYFKRLLSLFPAILILIINILPLSVGAASHSSSVSGWGYTGSGSERYYPPSAFGFSQSDKYLIVTYTRDDGDWSYNTSVAFDFTGQNGSFSVGDDGSLIYSGGFYVAQPQVFLNRGSASGSSWVSGNKKITFNPSTGSINYEFDGYYGSYISKFTLLKYETNVPDFNIPSIEVNDTLYPDFSINPVSRFIDGFSMEYGQIDVINNSNDDYEIALFFVQPNKDIHFIEPSEFKIDQSGKCWDNPDGEVVFPFASDEYFYTKSNSLNSKSYGDDLVGQSMFKVFAPSAVHPLKAGKTYSFYFGFNQVDLVKAHSYDIVLYAYAPYEDQNLHSTDFCPNAFEFYKLKEVYRRSFTMAESTPYDPSAPSLGTAQGTVYGFNVYNPDATFDSISGFEVNHDGSVGGSSTYKPIKDSFSNLQYSSGNGTYSFSGGGSSANFSSLIPVTSSYFSFLAMSLGYFPPIFLDIFSLALISFLVLAVIRRLK